MENHDRPNLYYPSGTCVLEKSNTNYAWDNFDVFIHDCVFGDAWTCSLRLRSLTSVLDCLLSKHFWLGIPVTNINTFSIFDPSHQENWFALFTGHYQSCSYVDVFHCNIDYASCKDYGS